MSEVNGMKSDRSLTILLGFALSFALSFACTACIATAFSDELNVALTELALWCAVYALLSSICFSFKLGLIFVNASLILAFLFCRYSDLIVSVRSLLQNLSEVFDKGYGWGGFEWNLATDTDHTAALQAVGSVICASVAWTVCRQRSCAWAIAGAILPFAPCTFMLKTVPDERCLTLFLFALIVLILTQPTRQKKVRDGNKLTLILLLPTLLAVMALFAFAPEETYEGKDYADKLLAKFEQFFEVSEPSAAGRVRRSENVDLTKVGKQSLPYRPVMEVISPFTERCYLRARAYDVYDGKSWTDSGISSELPWPQFLTGHEDFKIITKHVEPYLYQPYRLYDREHQQAGNALKNEDGEKEYTYTTYSDEYFTVPTATLTARKNDWDRLTKLPKDTLYWANDVWVREILPGSFAISMVPDANFLAECVKTYLSEKEYSLQTERMPEDRTDFARWFTEESSTGYCVHFATAATVLLRAQGVPARYISGYCVQTEADKKTTVYEKNSHAWVEYWSEETGWTVFEPTPSDEMFQQPDVTPLPTETTQVPTTSQEPTEPTQVSEEPTKPRPTLPSASEKPSEEKEEPFVLPQSIKWIAFILLMIALIIVQWRLRLILKRRAMARGNTNERALRIWKQIRSCRLTEDPQMLELARKAKFSNHTITQEELAQMEKCLENAIGQMREKAWYHKVIDRLILALY